MRSGGVVLAGVAPPRVSAARRAVAFGARAFFVVLGASAFLVPGASGVPWLDGAAELMASWFRFQCERDPARTLAGAAVCARCLGIYSGLAGGALFARPKLRTAQMQLWIAAAAALLLLDVVTEAVGLRGAWAPSRFATGALLAYPIAVVVVVALAGSERESDVPAATSRSEPHREAE